MKLLKSKNIFFVLGIGIIFISIYFVFRKLFLPGPVVWGDAPYFFPEGLRELISFPMSWTTRGVTLGGVNNFLWLYPIMLLYGSLNKLGLNNDLIIRLLFYFPGLILGTIGSIWFARKNKLGLVGQLFTALVYLINTYFILLIDGGQVGVVLAYGMFPLTLVLQNENFLIALGSVFILTVVDFRVAIICLLTSLLIYGIKNLKRSFLLILTLIGLSSYWWIPILRLSTNNLSTDVSRLQLTSFLNPLLLFQPLWPGNEFGRVLPPPFYFIGIPFLIFGSLFLVKKYKRTLKFLLVFLFFAFLIKGETPPLGFIYSFLVNKIPYGSLFRDSTKFFIPLLLIAGVLIGKTIETLRFKLFYVIIYAYLILLALPAILGNLNGVLGKSIDLTTFKNIQKLEESQSGFLRSAWFIEKNPFAYNTHEKQALDAKDLADFRPIASMNTGDGDRFNFINNNSFTDWFKLLGIKYLMFSGNPRKLTPDEAEQKDWNRLLNLVETNKDLKKVDIETDFPIYQLANIKPNIFVVDKTYFVVGGDDIYEKQRKANPNFSVGNQGFVFLEDGKLDPASFEGVASSSAKFIFNDKNENDLTPFYLQKFFVPPGESAKSDWAIRSSNDFLRWKFELLQNKIDTHEFDYGKGIAFSSVSGEKISFSVKASEPGDYYLLIRSMQSTSSRNLKLTFNNVSSDLVRKRDNSFEWFINGPINLQKGNYNLILLNISGFSVLNTVALVPTNEFMKAKSESAPLLTLFGSVDANSVIPIGKWQNYDPNNIIPNSWVIFTDRFDKNWEGSFPMYSMINGFYTGTGAKFKIFYKGEEYVRVGIYFSAVTLILIIIVYLYIQKRK